MKTILYIIKSLNKIGGLEKILLTKANSFANDYNYNVIILVLETNISNFFEISSKVKIEVFSLNKNLYSLYLLNKKINNLIEKYKINTLISLDGPEVYLIPFLKREKINFILENHFIKDAGIMDDKTKDKKNYYLYFRKKIINFFYKQFDYFIVLTERDKLEWKELKNVKVIPNCIEINHQKNDSDNIRKNQIISVGRLEKSKDFESLIRGFYIIAKKYPSWKLVIYGEGSEKENLAFLIKSLKLENQVKIKNFTNKIDEKYSESKIFCLTSLQEGFGLVIVEAMKNFLPVVVFDCPYGPREIIDNEKDGYLIENRNLMKLAYKLELLIKDENLRNYMGENAYKKSLKYSTKNIMKKWISYMN